LTTRRTSPAIQMALIGQLDGGTAKLFYDFSLDDMVTTIFKLNVAYKSATINLGLSKGPKTVNSNH